MNGGRNGDDVGDWGDADFDRIRDLYGRARYDSGAVDPATLATALIETGRYRLTVAEAVERYADADPHGLARVADDVASVLDADPDVARPLGRALGRLAGERAIPIEHLTDRFDRGQRRVAAAEGLADAASRDPRTVAPAAPDLLVALSRDDDAREPAIRALANLYVADLGSVRDRVRTGLSSPDHRRRGGAARVVCLAAAEGCGDAVDRMPVVGRLLAEPLGGWSSVLANRDVGAVLNTARARSAVLGDVLSGLSVVAENRPDALLDFVGTIDGASLYGDQADAAESVLGSLAAADEVVFETLLEQLQPGGIPRRLARLGTGDDLDRTLAAVEAAAADQADVLANRPEAIRSLWDRYPETAHELVAALARERPADAEWAVDPLLDRVDGRWANVTAAGSAFTALGVLARTYPTVPETLVERLRIRRDAWLAATVAAIRGVAAEVPESLVERTGPEGTPVTALLANALVDGPTDEAAFSLAHVGIFDPERVANLAPRVIDRVREPPAEDDRAWHVLASVVTHADPEAMESLGYTLIGNVQERVRNGVTVSRRDLDGYVLLLGALCANFETFAGKVVTIAADDPGGWRRTLLRILAEAGWPSETALAGSIDRLPALTRLVDGDERAVATKALASAVTEVRDPPVEATDRLTELLYDPDDAVRRWAAFGVGEWLATAPADGDEAVDRLERIAAVDAETPVVDLALVRAGERQRYDAVEDLERAARIDYRAIARVAVRELASAEPDAADDALAAVARDHVDPWVRVTAAALHDGDRSRRRSASAPDGDPPPER